MGKLTRGGLLLSVGMLAVLAGLLAGGLLHDGDAVPPAAAAPSRPAIAARPAPASAPTPVVAGGACGAVMDELRALQRAYPSGSMLTGAADEQLTDGLSRLDQACTGEPALAEQFRNRELTPWLTYLPPTSATNSPARIENGDPRAG